MNRKIWTLILSVVAVIVLGLGVYLITNTTKATSDGEVTIIFETIDEEKVEKVVTFKQGDSLHQLICDSFNNVVFDNGFLSAIESYVTPADYQTFICLYVNGNVSSVGIDSIELEDNMVILLKVEKNTYVEG